MQARINITTALKRHLRTHNLSIAAASGFTGLVMLTLWGAVYFFLHWLLLIKYSVFQQRMSDTPASFLRGYLLFVLVIVCIFWIARKLQPLERAHDHRSAFEHFLDILMFLPRFTVAMIENFDAWANFSRKEFAAAALLMDFLRTNERIQVQHLPLELPDPRLRTRVLHNLRVMQLVDEYREKGVTWLVVSPLAPECFRPNPREILQRRIDARGLPRLENREPLRLPLPNDQLKL